jgi:hypothetical protein
MLAISPHASQLPTSNLQLPNTLLACNGTASFEPCVWSLDDGSWVLSLQTPNLQPPTSKHVARNAAGPLPSGHPFGSWMLGVEPSNSNLQPPNTFLECNGTAPAQPSVWQLEVGSWEFGVDTECSHREQGGHQLDAVPQILQAQVFIGAVLVVVVIADRHHDGSRMERHLHVGQRQVAAHVR